MLNGAFGLKCNQQLLKKTFHLALRIPIIQELQLSTTENRRFKEREKLNLKHKFKYTKEFQKKFLGDNNDFELSNSKSDVESKDHTEYKNEKTPRKSKSWKTAKYPEICYKGEILFGVHSVHLALMQKKRKLYQLFLKDGLTARNTDQNKMPKEELIKLATILGIQISTVNLHTLNHLAPNSVHQGVCLDVSPYPLQEYVEMDTESECCDRNFPLWLVLDEIQDPMNVGAIIRSAYYFGVDKLFVASNNSCKLSPTVSKASSGALEVMDISQIQDLPIFLENRKKKGWSVISTIAYKSCASAHSVVDIRNFKMEKPTVLVLGNESKGTSSMIQSLSDNLLSVYPKNVLHSGVDSLNVSVATGIILYHLRYQKDFKASQTVEET